MSTEFENDGKKAKVEDKEIREQLKKIHGLSDEKIDEIIFDMVKKEKENEK